MSEAIYSKDKVFDLWCSEVDWVGKEFRSRGKGEGEWDLSDKQALIEKNKNFTQRNNCLSADFVLKIEKVLKHGNPCLKHVLDNVFEVHE